MKNLSRRQTLALMAAAAVGLTGMKNAPKNDRTLIVYFSRTGNTQAVAEIIARRTGGRLFALNPATSYPTDYQAQVEQAARELERGFLPKLAALPDVGGYERIFIGFPTWAMQMPPPVQSFLRQTDLTGKTLLPFNTHAGYGVGSGFGTLKRLAPNSLIKPGLSLQGGYERNGILLAIRGERRQAAERRVRTWLEQNGAATYEAFSAPTVISDQ